MKNNILKNNTLLKQVNKIGTEISRFILWLDNHTLWWIGLIFLGITFLPYLILGEGSVFEIHDQLDETLLTYVLNARHLGDGTGFLPELMGGVNASGMQPSAILFIPLYRLFTPFAAFLLQYLIVCACGYWGMYACTRKLTGSSILAVVTAVCFALLPMQPIYGLSAWGVPMLLYAFLCLNHRPRRHKTRREVHKALREENLRETQKADRRRLVCSGLLILLFGLTTHLVLIGYVVLSFWALTILWQIWRKNLNKWNLWGFVLLTGTYVAVNHSLFLELILGQSSYVSHREELVNNAYPFAQTAWDVFLNSSQHAVSLHKYLILPIVALLIIEGIYYRKFTRQEKERFLMAGGILIVLVAIALLFGFSRSQCVVDLKNRMSGFLRYFQIERFYWLYPTLWYLEFALVFSIWWKRKGTWQITVAKLSVLVILLLPTLYLIKPHCYFYQNVNQYNNGSGVTGYISWESYYAEELMSELEQTIGRDLTTYRVAHLGISPAPSLMHGFYTVDGYSNNYPLEYKHKFRQVIADELAKSEATRLYFDQWGSRCYLFNASSGTYWNVSKHENVKYEQLDFDMDALRELGCEYLFSGGEILCAQELGLEFMGYYETAQSYWGIWLYAVNGK